MMRTTLEIDDDVLAAARELAARDRKTAGKVISDLARRGIHLPDRNESRKVLNGFEVFPAGERVVTAELVQKLLDETNET